MTGACPFKLPNLDPLDSLVFTLFDECMSQFSWNSGMSERRTGIPYDRMKIKADALGIELNEITLSKFDLCVSVLVSSDIDSLNTEVTTTK